MSYQDRKDIDNLYDLIWDFDKNQTQFASKEEFEEFKKYVKLNYSMSAFIDALASNMDDNGLVLFENLQDGLTELETNLNGLQSNLTNLSGQLNGDSTHTGFVNILTNLQQKMYGEGEYDEEGHPYTYTNPSSTSLKGLLDALRGSLGELSEGDTQLAVTLSDLKSKLIGFSGNLTQFRDQIRQELGDTAYEQLNQDLLELIFNIASTNDQIDNHQQRIKATETLIGTEEDSASTQDGTAQNPYTVYGILNDTSDVASEANDSANEVIDTLYRGTGDDYNPNADPEHPADNTTLQWLGDTSTTANKVDGYVGDVRKFTEATISDALKNRADGQTAITNKIGNTTYTGSTLTGAIASMQTKIGTVNFNGNSISHALNTMQTQIGSVNVSGSLRSDINSLQTQIGNVNFNGGTVTNALNSLQTQIGTVNVNGSLTSAIESLQTNIGNVSLLNGSSISLSIYNSQVNIGNIQGNIGNVNLFTGNTISGALGNAQGDIEDLQTDTERLVEENKNTQVIWVEGNNQSFSDLREIYGIELSNINYKYKNGNYYVRNKTVWTQISETLIDKVDFVCGVTLNDYTEMPLDSGFISRFKNIYFYGKATQKHRGLKWVESLTSSNKWAMQNTNGDDYIGVDLAYELYDPQTLSNIGSYGNPQNKINKNIDTAIGTLNTLKQDTIPNFSLISTQTGKGLTVKVYSDGLNVYVTVSGNGTGLNTTATNNGVTTILTLSNTNYSPSSQVQVPARGQSCSCRLRILSDGSVQFISDSPSVTAYTLNGTFYYPLKSRLP